MPKVGDTKAATLEHFQLVVYALHKATAVAMAEVVGDQREPGVQELEEAVIAGETALLYLSTPALDTSQPFRLRARTLKNRTQLFSQVIRVFQLWAMLKQSIQALLLFLGQIARSLAKRPQCTFERFGLVFAQLSLQALELVFAQIVRLPRGSAWQRENGLSRTLRGRPYI